MIPSRIRGDNSSSLEDTNCELLQLLIHCCIPICLSSNTVKTFLELCVSHAQISGPAPTFSTAVFGLGLLCQADPPQLLGEHLNPSSLVPGPATDRGGRVPGRPILAVSTDDG